MEELPGIKGVAPREPCASSGSVGQPRQSWGRPAAWNVWSLKGTLLVHRLPQDGTAWSGAGLGQQTPPTRATGHGQNSGALGVSPALPHNCSSRGSVKPLRVPTSARLGLCCYLWREFLLLLESFRTGFLTKKSELLTIWP